jgi:hypothetical protein
MGMDEKDARTSDGAAMANFIDILLESREPNTVEELREAVRTLGLSPERMVAKATTAAARSRATSSASAYEKRALKEIRDWKNPRNGWMQGATKMLNWPIDKAAGALGRTPGLEWVVQKGIGGVLALLNDAALWSVRRDAVFVEYGKLGHSQVRALGDVFVLDLEEVDRAIGWLGAKYKGLAAAGGGAAGVAGLAGIAPDVVALLSLCQRAVGEYATYCGFDVSLQQERLFAMQILGVASSGSDTSKYFAMAQLIRLGQDVASKKAWAEIERHAFARIIQQVARSLGMRLTKAKLAQIIPIMGGLVGAGFNTYFMMKVCDSASMLYRERFLAEKYGPDVIDISVPPAAEINAGSEEE